MPVSTLTSKGQITVPQAVRKSLGLQAGDRLDFVPDEEGGFKVIPLRKDVSVLKGRFAGRTARPVSLEEMAEAIEAEACTRAR
jgi:AbrB family looped-hinge helix DNA binding protein